VCMLPYLVGMSGLIYLAGAVILNTWFMVMAIKLKFRAKPSTAMDTFKFSILHLMILFVVLLVDHYVAI